MAKRKRRYEEPETWRRRIDAWQRSGLSVTDFVAQEGLCQTTFLRWRKKLGGDRWIRRPGGETSGETQQRPPSTTIGGEGPESVSFVELAPRQISAVQPPTLVEFGVPFEVSLRSGRRLQVPASFDPETLRQLVAILEVQ
jgi:hypothetical protein